MSLESLENALSSQLTCGELWSLLVCLERAACCGGEPRRIDVRLPLFDATAQVLRATGFTFGLPVLVTRSKVAVLLWPPAEAQCSLPLDPVFGVDSENLGSWRPVYRLWPCSGRK